MTDNNSKLISLEDLGEFKSKADETYVSSKTHASTTEYGTVKIDGNTIKINSDGQLVGSNDYTLPTASTTTLGGVKVDGTTVTADADGTIHGASTYTLPPATKDTLGGVKVDGETVTVDEDGTIHGSSSYVLPTASTTTLGGVKVDGETIVITDGVIKESDNTIRAVGEGKPGDVSITADKAIKDGNGNVIVNTYINKSELDAKADKSTTLSGYGITNAYTKTETDTQISDAISTLPNPMVFKGSLGTDGTITELPEASSDNEGFVYKVITAGTYASQTAKVGDVFISNGTSWILVPSGDEPSGTVTNVAIKMNGSQVGEAITTSGTIDLGTVITEHQDISGKMDKANPTGTGNLAVGSNVTVGGSYSVAVGKDTSALSSWSFAEGNGTTAHNGAAHAEGMSTTASGTASHSEGISTTASGDYSHAEGAYTSASGIGAHAEGTYTTASGTGAHAEGTYTIASRIDQHAQGKYNIEDTEGIYADIVGGGTSDTARKNIATLDWSGNAVYAGDVTSTKSDGTTTSLNTVETAISLCATTADLANEEHGKNLFYGDLYKYGLTPDGSESSSTLTVTTDFIEVSSSTKYTISFQYSSLGSSSDRYILTYDSSKTVLSALTYSPSSGNATIETDATAKYIRVCLDVKAYNIQIEEGTSASDYEKYYKGNGALTEDSYKSDSLMNEGIAYPTINGISNYVDSQGVYHKRLGCVDLGTLSWWRDSTSGHERFYGPISDMKAFDVTKVANIYCGRYAVVSANDTYSHTQDDTISADNSNRLNLYDSSYTDLDTLKSALSGVLLFYELDTEHTWNTKSVLFNRSQTIGNLKVNAIGNLVVINGYVTGLSITTDGIQVGTLSDIPLPQDDIRVICNVGNNAWTATAIGYFTIGTDGTIRVKTASGTQSTFYVSCSYVSA